MPDGEQERRAAVNSIPMRWLERGAGPPVVLIHGIPTSPRLWRHVVPALHGARLLAWEMVGYGGSWRAADGHDISVGAQAGYLLAWLEQLGIERALLAGHDLGGGVAQIAAVRHPQRCAGLVLTNSISYDSWPIPSVKALAAAGGLVRSAPRAVLRMVIASFLRRGHGDQARATEAIREHWPHYDHEHGPAAFVRQVRSLRTEDTLAVADRLRDLDVPAALVWGASDRFQKIDYGRSLAAALRGDLEAIDTGKHFVPEDHPKRIVDAIRRVAGDARF